MKLFQSAMVAGAVLTGALIAGEAEAPKRAPAAPKVAAPKAETPAPKAEQPAPAAKDEVPADVRNMTHPGLLIDLAQVYMRYAYFERAEEYLRKALAVLKEGEERNRANVTLSTILQSRKDFAGAAACYEEVIKGSVGGQRDQNQLSLSDIYVQQGEFAKAEQMLSELAGMTGAVKPEEQWIQSSAWQRLTTVWQKQEGKLEKATAELEAKQAEDPKNMVLTERLVALYSMGPKRDAAKAAGGLEKVRASRPKDISVLLRLAALHTETRAYDKAIAIHQELIALDPNGVAKSSIPQLANLMLQSGKKAEAAAFMKQNSGTDESGMMALEGFYEQAGMFAEAEELLVKLAELAPEKAKKADTILRAAEMARNRKEYAKSEERIRVVITEFGEDKALMGRAKQMLVRLYEEQGRISELKL